MVVPDEFRSNKKQRQDVGLRELCLISSKAMADITRFPNVDELPTLLLQPLPFRLEIMDTMLWPELFAPDARQFKCEEMKALVNAITLKCKIGQS